MGHKHSVTRWGLVLGLLVFLASPALAAAPDRFYVSLGTSLAAGTQPDAAGVDQTTDEGYADQLHRLLQVKDRRLKLKKLGCPDETTVSMIFGGTCLYPGGGSQLDEAIAFLRTNRGAVSLVTIDMGANDLLDCLGASGIDFPCIFGAFANVGANLPIILTQLRAAAGDGVPIVAMNYYNPLVALWLQGDDARAMALQSADLLTGPNGFNALLQSIYTVFEVPVGDVARAFRSDDFTIVPRIGLPANVLLVCQLTWMCTPFNNIHPNRTGYFVIALVLASAMK